MSGLDFLALVLQSSYNFDLHAFSFFFSLFLPDYKVRLELLHLGSVYVKELFGLG